MKAVYLWAVLLCRIAAVGLVGVSVYALAGLFDRYEIEIKLRPRAPVIVLGPTWT